MAVNYYFFDNQSIYQQDWQKTIGNVLHDGVVCGYLNDLFTYGDASGMQVKVRSGMFHIKGNYYTNDAEQVLAIGAAPTTAGNIRIDLVVGEVNWGTKSMSIKILAGTEAAIASAVAPAMIRTSTIWQIALARIGVGANVTNIAANVVYDMRKWALGTFNLPIIIGHGLSTITTGAAPVAVVIPVRSKIVGYYLIGDVAGSIQIDLWKDLSSAYPPTVADTICNSSHKPSLSSVRSRIATVWNEATYTNALGANWPGYVFDPPEDALAQIALLANVDSVATVKQVALNLTFARMISA